MRMTKAYKIKQLTGFALTLAILFGTCIAVENIEFGKVEAAEETTTAAATATVTVTPTVAATAEPTATPTVKPTVKPTATPWVPDEQDVEYIAKVLWGECRGVKSKTERAAVAWTVLNRVDSDIYPDTVKEVVEQKHQFCGYRASNPVTDELAELAADVLCRWHEEKMCSVPDGRVLPSEYLFFVGDGKHNHFSKVFRSKKYWDFHWYSPYED